jgi:hypothetical protein
MVDQRERTNDQEESMRLANDSLAQTLWCVMPVLVKEDSEGHTVRLRPAIKAVQRNEQGQMEPVEMSWLGSCPVAFTQGGEFVITHPVKEKDEGIVVFADRNIDGWWKDGDVQPEIFMRRHHLSDGMYIPGVRSCPRALGGNPQQLTNGHQRQSNDSRKPSTATIQIRTEQGDHYIELTGAEQAGQSAVDIIVHANDAIEGKPGPLVNIVCVRANIKASEKVHFDTPLFETTGEIKAKGEITAKADVSASDDYSRAARSAVNDDARRLADITPFSGESVTLSQHVHERTQSAPPPSESGPPKPGS